MASVDDRVQYGPLKKLEVKNCVAYSGITCILGFLLFAFILMLIPGDAPEPPVLYGVISGVVLGPDNLPVENIEVSCSSFETVTTNANGEFSFPEAVYGEFVLTIDHPNYEQETVNVVLGAASVDVEISLTYSPVEILFRARREFTLQSFEGVTTTLTCGSFVASLDTNSNGMASFNAPVRGACVVEFSKQYFVTQTREITAPSSTTLTINLPAEATLSINVVDDTFHYTLPHVKVVLSHDGVEYEALTNWEGNVYFDNLPLGVSYSIRIESPGYETITTSRLFQFSYHLNYRLVPV
ncbi:hypothetical protein RCL1_007168 [Eukaryota sp. TZLM3-RCL]